MARVHRFGVLLLVVLLHAPSIDAFAAKAKSSSKGKKAKASSAKGGGFGAAKAAAVAKGPTPAQLLKASMEQYEVLEKLRYDQDTAEAEAEYGEGASEDKDDDDSTKVDAVASVTKWVVAVRSTGDSAEFSDWVPAAMLSLAVGTANGNDPETMVSSALGAVVKEVLEAVCQSQSAMRKVGRETIEYAYEPLDSFETHVYEGLTTRAERRSEAVKTLGIEKGASAKAVKMAHRKLMMELHPDRFVGDEEGAKRAQEQMLLVQEAYGELGGGKGTASGSFYQSVGGKGRVGFTGALAKEDLAPLGKPRPAMEHPYELGGWRVGIVPMSTELQREFVTRNLMRYSKDDDKE